MASLFVIGFLLLLGFFAFKAGRARQKRKGDK
jgi:hypothetical protein